MVLRRPWWLTGSEIVINGGPGGPPPGFPGRKKKGGGWPGRGRPGWPGGDGPGNGGDNAWPDPTFANVLFIEHFEDVSDANMDIGGPYSMTWSTATAGSPQLFGVNTVDLNGAAGIVTGLIGDSIETLWSSAGGSDIFAMYGWIYPTALGNANMQCVASCYNASSNSRKWLLEIDRSDGARASAPDRLVLTYTHQANAFSPNTQVVSSRTLVQDAWNFVGFAHNVDDFYIYSGPLSGAVTVDKVTSTSRPGAAGAPPLEFGDLNNGGEIFAGRFAEWRSAIDEAYFPTDTDSGVVLAPTGPFPTS